MGDFKPSELLQELQTKSRMTEGGLDVTAYCRLYRDSMARAANRLAEYEIAEEAIRDLFNLPTDGKDLFETLADWQQDMVAGGVRLQNAVHNIMAERLYENGRKDDGVAVHFLMRLSMLANEAGLGGYSKDNPVVAEAIGALGDPGQANITESATATKYQGPCRPIAVPFNDDENPFLFGR